MADDLDDFFAKKDKKKSKIKKYTPDLLASKYNEADVAAIPTATPPIASSAAAKKVPEKKKEDTVSSDTNDASKPKAAPAEPEEEEWANEFEQEKERDYSGLKIQKLQILDSEEEDDQECGEAELNEEGEPIKRGPAGPWNKLTNAAPTTVNVKTKEVAPVENLPNTAGGVYIPPSKRMQAASGSGSTARPKAGKKTGAPDLSNEEYFPSLGQAQAIEEKNFKLKKFDQQERGFTEAKPSRSHSSRTAVNDQDGPRLNLGNKFHALCNEDS